jgi:hypothetical protein
MKGDMCIFLLVRPPAEGHSILQQTSIITKLTFYVLRYRLTLFCIAHATTECKRTDKASDIESMAGKLRHVGKWL